MGHPEQGAGGNRQADDGVDLVVTGAGDDKAHASGGADKAHHHRNHHETRLGWGQGVHHLQVGWHVAQNTEHCQAKYHAGEGGQGHVAVLE